MIGVAVNREHRPFSSCIFSSNSNLMASSFLKFPMIPLLFNHAGLFQSSFSLDCCLVLQPLMASLSSEDELLSNPQFAGLFRRLNMDQDDVPSATEVVDDYEGEQESIDLQNSGDIRAEENADDDDSDLDSEDSDEDAGDEASIQFSGLEDVVKNASKGITDGTEGEYRRSEHNCLFFYLVSDCYLLVKWRDALNSW